MLFCPRGSFPSGWQLGIRYLVHILSTQLLLVLPATFCGIPWIVWPLYVR